MPIGLPADAATLRKHSTWFIVYGVVFIILGLLSIAAPMVATLAVSLMLGWLLLIGGSFSLIASLFGGAQVPNFGWTLLTAIIYILAGLALLLSPAAGALTLTIIIAAYLFAGGIMRIMMAFGYRAQAPSAWGWFVVSGIVDIVLALLIVSGLPGTAIWVLGLLVGINLLVMGFSIVMVALAVRRMLTA